MTCHKTATFLVAFRDRCRYEALQQPSKSAGSKMNEIRLFEQKNGIRLDDEVRFIRSWIEKPLATGAVTPSGKRARAHHGALCRSRIAGPGDRARARHRPGHRGAGRAGGRSRSGWCWSSSIRRSASCCARAFPSDRGAGRRLRAARGCSAALLQQPAAAVVSGLPLMTKPLRMRAAAVARGLRAAAAERAVRAVHLRGGAADPASSPACGSRPPSASG